MIRKTGGPRRAVALPLIALLLATSAGVPLLDEGRDPLRLAVAGPDDAPAGLFDHAHELCIQHGATAWAPAPAAVPPIDHARAQAPHVSAADASPIAALHPNHRPRAPPVV